MIWMSFWEIEDFCATICISDLQIHVGIELRFVVSVIEFAVEIVVNERDVEPFEIIVTVERPMAVDDVFLSARFVAFE